MFAEWIAGIGVIVSTFLSVYAWFTKREARVAHAEAAKQSEATEEAASAAFKAEGINEVLVKAIEDSSEVIGEENTQKLKDIVRDAAIVVGKADDIYNIVKAYAGSRERG